MRHVRHGLKRYVRVAGRTEARGEVARVRRRRGGVLTAEDHDDPGVRIEEVVSAGVRALGVPARHEARVVSGAWTLTRGESVRGVDRRRGSGVVPVGLLPGI